jgi:hypothetical protein
MGSRDATKWGWPGILHLFSISFFLADACLAQAPLGHNNHTVHTAAHKTHAQLRRERGLRGSILSVSDQFLNCLDICLDLAGIAQETM